MYDALLPHGGLDLGRSRPKFKMRLPCRRPGGAQKGAPQKSSPSDEGGALRAVVEPWVAVQRHQGRALPLPTSAAIEARVVDCYAYANALLRRPRPETAARPSPAGGGRNLVRGRARGTRARSRPAHASPPVRNHSPRGSTNPLSTAWR